MLSISLNGNRRSHISEILTYYGLDNMASSIVQKTSEMHFIDKILNMTEYDSLEFSDKGSIPSRSSAVQVIA